MSACSGGNIKQNLCIACTFIRDGNFQAVIQKSNKRPSVRNASDAAQAQNECLLSIQRMTYLILQGVPYQSNSSFTTLIALLMVWRWRDRGEEIKVSQYTGVRRELSLMPHSVI